MAKQTLETQSKLKYLKMAALITQSKLKYWNARVQQHHLLGQLAGELPCKDRRPAPGGTCGGTISWWRGEETDGRRRLLAEGRGD
jgi:hypothetical protein